MWLFNMWINSEHSEEGQPSPHVSKRDLLNFFLSRRDSDEYLSLCLYNKGHHHLNIYMIIMKIKLTVLHLTLPWRRHVIYFKDSVKDLYVDVETWSPAWFLFTIVWLHTLPKLDDMRDCDCDWWTITFYIEPVLFLHYS